MLTLYTIGHSSHTAEHFTTLLRQHGIQRVVDTRSAPYSRYTPHFDRESLRNHLHTTGIEYCYLGDAVGGRPREESCYDADGRVLYSHVSRLPVFRDAIESLLQDAAQSRVALLCSEEDPAHCHRRLLISRVLLTAGATISHIRGDGRLETDAEVEAASGKRLIEPQPPLFTELEDRTWRSTSVIGTPAARSAIG
jgi:uncharacterized protein (DUF488 family)